MNHAAYIRTVAGSDTAVLMLHGIAGTPDHFDALLPLLPDSWTVHNLLLDGHGGTVADFGRTSMKKWESQASSALVQLLAQHSRVLIVAHSMGTLFAIKEAVLYPQRIGGLFLLAVPMRPIVRLRTGMAAVKLMLGIAAGDQTAAAMQHDCSVALTPGLWQYLPWIPRFIELLSQIRHTRRMLPLLAVPTVAVQSECDELVSNRSSKDLGKNPCIKVVRLPSSGHFGYTGADCTALLAQFAAWVERQSQ